MAKKMLAIAFSVIFDALDLLLGNSGVNGVHKSNSHASLLANRDFKFIAKYPKYEIKHTIGILSYTKDANGEIIALRSGRSFYDAVKRMPENQAKVTELQRWLCYFCGILASGSNGWQTGLIYYAAKILLDNGVELPETLQHIDVDVVEYTKAQLLESLDACKFTAEGNSARIMGDKLLRIKYGVDSSKTVSRHKVEIVL